MIEQCLHCNRKECTDCYGTRSIVGSEKVLKAAAEGKPPVVDLKRFEGPHIDRYKQVYEMYCAGMNDIEMAAVLQLSTGAVNYYRRAMGLRAISAPLRKAIRSLKCREAT